MSERERLLQAARKWHEEAQRLRDDNERLRQQVVELTLAHEQEFTRNAALRATIQRLRDDKERLIREGTTCVKTQLRSVAAERWAAAVAAVEGQDDDPLMNHTTTNRCCEEDHE